MAVCAHFTRIKFSVHAVEGSNPGPLPCRSCCQLGFMSVAAESDMIAFVFLSAIEKACEYSIRTSTRPQSKASSSVKVAKVHSCAKCQGETQDFDYT